MPLYYNVLIIDITTGIKLINEKTKLLNTSLCKNIFLYSFNLISLTFDMDYSYNLQITYLLSDLAHLTYLTFGNEFNQPLENSLDKLINLTHLTFGRYFN